MCAMVLCVLMWLALPSVAPLFPLLGVLSPILLGLDVLSSVS